MHNEALLVHTQSNSYHQSQPLPILQEQPIGCSIPVFHSGRMMHESASCLTTLKARCHLHSAQFCSFATHCSVSYSAPVCTVHRGCYSATAAPRQGIQFKLQRLMCTVLETPGSIPVTVCAFAFSLSGVFSHNTNNRIEKLTSFSLCQPGVL